MAATGCPKPAMRSVEFARNHHVPLHVRSSFTWEPGTWVTEEDPSMEAGDHLRRHARHVRGEGHGHRRARQARHRGATVPRPRRRVVNVDMIVQNTSIGGATDISFTVPKADLAASERVTGALVAEIGASGVTHDENIGRVSARRRRHEDEPGRRGDDVRDAGRQRHQHRDDLDLGDPHLVRGRCSRGRAGGAGTARRVRAGRLKPQDSARGPPVA